MTLAKGNRLLVQGAIHLLTIITCLWMGGCPWGGTMGARINEPYTESPHVYPATAFDLTPHDWSIPLPWWMIALDLPFALVTDTVLLPVDVYKMLHNAGSQNEDRHVSGTTSTETEAGEPVDGTRRDVPGKGILLIQVTLEDDAEGRVTISLKDTLERNILMRGWSGNLQLDLGLLPDGYEHYLCFRCPGFSIQCRPVLVFGGQCHPNELHIKLFRTRYVVMRYAFHEGKRALKSGTLGVQEERKAFPPGTGPEFSHLDWQVLQWTEVPDLAFHRITLGFGLLRAPPGTSYEDMVEAPETGYQCRNMKAEPGLVLYCRVNGGSREGLGYGKLMVEDVTEAPPAGVPVAK
ncbi:MAG: YceK/YidQ family lipoprotein [Sedimentisphaerales bacterium]|nr:YceK/YidQ family lipoprotein [Sedimentisphaerales bacterium]